MTRVVRIVLIVALAALVVWLLFTVVFPWVDRTFVDDPVLGVALAGEAVPVVVAPR